ncbi:type 1 glutamine amidotransferase [Sphingomonas sp. H39-1-10]|uniref:type 1 glutamine amidotransferase n=1 Tax=Sphingomonas TaxID=13687 RepID=UPI0008924341|nr:MULTISPECIES: type 1 glutamine amidotransferase [Sphingomonas]MDF0489627.1 type 1 glutamine amidotransferase [Sphingomonas pollutisoli]SDA36841.1 GMP synthase (glutamine-hydrolysing) [Sphingomonas sp. NFR15]
MHFLVAESEPPNARERRRKSVGKSSGETFVDMLAELVPGARCDRVTPADADASPPDAAAIERYDAVFLTGSPLHVYEDTPEVARQLAFMREVFASGTPAFGSCAGLQVAAAAAGGTVRAMGPRREAGFARRITPTEAGRTHPLLRGRPAAFDAPAIHTDEVADLPPGALLLASNGVTRVQAAEIRFARGVFWGVQYHPELSLAEVAAALRRQSDDLIAHDLARSTDDVEQIAALVDALGDAPCRVDLAWRLGLDAQVIDLACRRLELRNFITFLVEPTMAERGRTPEHFVQADAAPQTASAPCRAETDTPRPERHRPPYAETGQTGECV